MTNSNAFHLLGRALKRSVLAWALPHIVQVPPAEWDDALKRARETNFDTIERIGVLAGIAFTTYLLRFDANEAEISLPIRFLAQFAAAVPLLILLVGPFYLRCLRRGLDHVIEHRRIAG
ncbi:MAG: hypothetical protein H6R17_2643 [Proteobacteria bacterium]|nr:hypothetical protein [Pseudomonadota bacterium]